MGTGICEWNGGPKPHTAPSAVCRWRESKQLRIRICTPDVQRFILPTSIGICFCVGCGYLGQRNSIVCSLRQWLNFLVGIRDEGTIRDITVCGHRRAQFCSSWPGRYRHVQRSKSFDVPCAGGQRNSRVIRSLTQFPAQCARFHCFGDYLGLDMEVVLQQQSPSTVNLPPCRKVRLARHNACNVCCFSPHTKT